MELAPETGRYEITDKQSGVTWRSNPHPARFGELTCIVAGKPQRLDLARCSIAASATELSAEFRPLAQAPDAALRVRIRAFEDGRTLEFRYEADPALAVESVRLLDDALWVTDTEKGALFVPVREGLLVPADSGLAFMHRFETNAYEGCHMAMLGAVKDGAAALLTWDDPYVTADLRSVVAQAPWLAGRQALLPSLTLRKSARAFRLQLLGKGDHVAIAKAYRQVAKERGLLVPWQEKLAGHPGRAKLFGAVNFKLWSALNRQMNDESTREESVRVNWTFDEAAQIAEHLRRDLQLERVLFTVGGWIHRGYDNQHPDILPTAPECGGDAALADCARRVRGLGYLFALHDNYQDIYRDSPSWSEELIEKDAAGDLVKGGRWAGGRAFIICSQKAPGLAKRPQNLPAVRKLTGADAYFIDTTFAAGLHECFDPAHPLLRGDDMRWKEALSDEARGVFGVFGSECGREWAIPHADFFEGMTGVSGRNFHDEKLQQKLGAEIVPLFELVYRDCIAAFGKYGYDPGHAAEYMLQHLVLGRPLNYHSIPAHLYWKAGEAEALRVVPGVAELKPRDARSFAVTWRWDVEQTPPADWRVFVHFTDANGAIKFQGDYAPKPAMTSWQSGEVRQGPFTLRVPDGLSGPFDVRVGLIDPATGARPRLAGLEGEHRSYRIGRLRLDADRAVFEPEPVRKPAAGGDPALFTRGDGGWTAGLHSLDRFIKNTAEVLSPLHEITATVPMTRHEFLGADRKAQRSLFGNGPDAVEVIVNFSPAEYRHRSPLGGEVVLPPFGFVVEGARFVAFHANCWAGVRYEDPPLFTMRSLDGLPISSSRRIRVFHAFGDPRLSAGGVDHTVIREALIEQPPPAHASNTP